MNLSLNNRVNKGNKSGFSTRQYIKQNEITTSLSFLYDINIVF